MAEIRSSTSAPERGLREVTVLAADDHRPFQLALRRLLDATPGFTLVGQTASGEETVAAATMLEPDLILMDVNMPGIGGIEATRTIVAQHPNVTVWLVSIDGGEDLGELARSCGAHGFVRKQDLRPRVLRKMWATHHA